MRAVPRPVVLVALLGAFFSPALVSQQPEQKPKRPATLIVSLGPHFGYTPLEDRGPSAKVTPQTPSEYERARELFAFQIIANRPDEPTGDQPGSVIASGVVRRGESVHVKGKNRDLEVIGHVSLANPGVARYEAELRVAGKSVSSTGATLRIDALR